MTRPWYSPSRIACWLCATLVGSTSDPQLQALGAFLYGAIDLLGVKGSVQLILKLRRKHNGRTKTKTPAR